MTPFPYPVDDGPDPAFRSVRAPASAPHSDLARRRVDALVAFVSFSLFLTILGLVFFALETWHA